MKERPYDNRKARIEKKFSTEAMRLLMALMHQLTLAYRLSQHCGAAGVFHSIYSTGAVIKAIAGYQRVLEMADCRTYFLWHCWRWRGGGK